MGKGEEKKTKGRKKRLLTPWKKNGKKVKRKIDEMIEVDGETTASSQRR